jgi:hypothetical protein
VCRAALLLVIAAFLCGGCSIAYVPGDETRQEPTAETPAQLRALVLVLTTRCTQTVVGGTVANRSEHALVVVVRAGMYTAGGVKKEVSIPVDAPPSKTVPWHAPAPRGTTPDGGCEGYAKSVRAR